MQKWSDPDDDRRRIIEAAHRCLSEPHSGPIPVSAILRSAEVSTRAFYRHFSSKDELFLALLQQECEKVAARVERIAAAAVGTPANQLAAWIGEMFDLMVEPEQRAHLSVVDSEEVRMAKGYQETRDRARCDRERSLATILRRGRDDGSFPITDPDCDAELIGAVVSRALNNETPDDLQHLKQTQAKVLDFALRAVGAVAAV
ncbi:TetR/AcrR family transcriptional regulator [Mycobacterium sp. DL]|uniref:Transcriptional regulator, AcrR family n=1 Tax=Mycolicibacterium hippocampi TaxID=659824 RepID=A0A850PH90_9MYCO|nr:Transcriptional regulator, AcrR family [Mycolicibacterium hippocampi]